jgi:CDK-activating kinase assembly factor MAT1
VLRKLAFTPQTFEDLGVEKEVAIRRRLAKEYAFVYYSIFALLIYCRFNKRRDDFATLRDYNDYLQFAEDIAFNLINNIDVSETEQRIADFRAQNAALIALNIQREEADAQALKEQEEYERKEREYRAAELRREEEEERNERERDRREIIDELEAGSKDARKLIAKYAKRKTARQGQQEEQLGGYGDYARLLKSRSMSAQKAAVKDEPHVPMQDDWYAYEDMFILKPGGYDDPFSEAVRKDREGIMRGGGYRVEEAWERAIRSAVAGLNLAPLTGLPQSTEPAGDVVMSSA